MLKFILQLAVFMSAFIGLMFLLSLLEPVFTNPIVFTVIMGFIVVAVIKIFVRR
jgi:hypothetical protein